MKKRITSALLSLVLILSLMPAAAHAMSFPDVDSNSGYAAAIAYVSELKIMVGDSSGNFNPNGIVSRCEMAAIVCRVLGQTENLSKSNIFTDVPLTHWANAYIGKASELGIVGGYGNGKFGPGDPVTYEQAVTMVVRTIGEDERAKSNGGYPKGYLLVAQEKNLLYGIQAAQGQGLSRGAVAMLLYNYYVTQFITPNNPGASSDAGEHTHNYIEQTVPGAGGHYEQVQVGTEKVLVDTIKKEYSQCMKCGAIAYTNEEALGHYDPESPYFSRDCILSRNMIYTEATPIYEEQPVYENRWVEDSTTIRVCSICGQQEPEAHTHNYVTKTVPGTGGHYEQVQVGTEKVLVRNEQRSYSQCLKCGAIAYTTEEIYGHRDPESPYFSKDCWNSRNMIYTEYVPVYEEQPKYENKWIEDSTTIRVCSICGQQEP